MTSDSQVTAYRISEAVPVRLSPNDVEKNPGFVKLLTQLSRHIAKDGTSTVLKKDVEQASARLREEKSRWLEQHVLLTELHELLLDQQLKPKGASSSTSFYEAVSEMLTMTQIGDYLECHPDPGSETTLFGLKKSDIDRRNPHRRHVQSIQQKLIPDLENCLRKRCDELVGFHDSCSLDHTKKSNSNKLTFAKASQLPAVLEAEQSTLQEEKRQYMMDKVNRDNQLTQYYQTLVDSLSTLETLISRHRLRSQSERDRISSEWLTARCDAMCLKIKIIQLQTLCETYYADTVQALTTIRRHLDKAIADTEDELFKATEALKAYETVGMGFDSLVDEYTHLRGELENRRWTLRELRQHGPTEDNFPK